MASEKQYRRTGFVYAWQFLGVDKPLAEGWVVDDDDPSDGGGHCGHYLHHKETDKYVLADPHDWIVNDGNDFYIIGDFEFRQNYEETEGL